MTTDEKPCRTCGITKPLASFHRNRSRSDGRAVECASCCCDRQARYRKSHPDKVAERKHRYYAENGEQVRAANHAYRQANAERCRAQELAYRSAHADEKRARDRQYRADHCDERRDRDRAYRLAHPQPREIARARAMRYRHANPHIAAEWVERRRARIKGAPVIEKIDRAAIVERDKRVCHICGLTVPEGMPRGHPQALTLDHVIPLASGGAHATDNLRVAHHGCNSRKGAKYP